jgi:hypothetical protein
MKNVAYKIRSDILKIKGLVEKMEFIIENIRITKTKQHPSSKILEGPWMAGSFVSGQK